MKTSEFSKTISQLRLMGGAMKVPHPLCNHPLEEIDNFHLTFIQYCMKNNLPNVVWQYCCTHK